MQLISLRKVAQKQITYRLMLCTCEPSPEEETFAIGYLPQTLSPQVYQRHRLYQQQQRQQAKNVVLQCTAVPSELADGL